MLICCRFLSQFFFLLKYRCNMIIYFEDELYKLFSSTARQYSFSKIKILNCQMLCDLLTWSWKLRRSSTDLRDKKNYHYQCKETSHVSTEYRLYNVSIVQAFALMTDNKRGARLKFSAAPANKPQAVMKDNNASLRTFQNY